MFITVFLSKEEEKLLLKYFYLECFRCEKVFLKFK